MSLIVTEQSLVEVTWAKGNVPTCCRHTSVVIAFHSFNTVSLSRIRMQYIVVIAQRRGVATNCYDCTCVLLRILPPNLDHPVGHETDSVSSLDVSGLYL